LNAEFFTPSPICPIPQNNLVIVGNFFAATDRSNEIHRAM